MGNAYLEKRDADRRQFFEAGCDLVAQQMYDMMCLVLNDPEIMGKDVFGANRLKKVHDAMYERERMYHEAWICTQESDWYQEKLDAALRNIFGADFAPFKERYPHQKEWNYNKPCKK